MDDTEENGEERPSKRRHSVYTDDPPSAQEPSISSRQAKHLKVQSLLRGHFNEDFQPTRATFPLGFRKVVPPCDLEGFLSVTATFRPVVPPNSYFSMYADVSDSRDVMLQKAGGAVCAAYEIAYGDQIAVYSAFMASALAAQQIPYQPQTSLKRFLVGMHKKRQNDKTRLAQFVAMLPGFEDISPADRNILLAEKSFVTNLLNYIKYCHKGDYYYPLPGPEQIHASNYWMEIMGLDPEYIRFCYKFSSMFNRIGLTLTESYLLLAAAFFDPDTTTASDKALLKHLNAFYLDALMYMIGYRCRHPWERAAVYHKFEEAVKMFHSLPAVPSMV
ncbi:uncharacterized protein LOC129588875 [Paramacrobiotus metropolitanus]|uniref:uncharacterized protein LOC129588875 n=1 Tax=Paramacrobiotus metropolitanus TaxID=2943436 RepID=UPI0024457A80|nr:uncharacterized protein LOC129588875 [Paramacrobiotus metropolitanus]